MRSCIVMHRSLASMGLSSLSVWFAHGAYMGILKNSVRYHIPTRIKQKKKKRPH